MRLGLCMGRISWNDFNVLKSMILGQLNCLLFLEFLHSSTAILDSVTWSLPIRVCLPFRTTPDLVVTQSTTLAVVGKNRLLSPTNILSSRLGKTITFKEVIGSMPQGWIVRRNLRGNSSSLETWTPTQLINEHVSSGEEVIKCFPPATWHNLCYTKDSLK